MSYIKFLTVCDDEFGTLLTAKIRLQYEISLLPSRYIISGSGSCFDIVNTNGREYAEQMAAGEILRSPDIEPSLFSYFYALCNANGYDALYVLCPHSKWYPYYDSARRALQAFRRTKAYPGDEVYSVRIVDTGSFSFGTLYHTYRLARENKLSYCDLGTMDFWNGSFQQNARTLIFSDSENVSFPRRGSLFGAYDVSGHVVKSLDISESVDEVQFDRFAEAASKAIRKADGKYLVSFGSGFSYAGNILGRIESLSGYTPIACGQYGVATAAVLGTGALCIHLF